MGTSRYIRARQLMSRETLIDAPFTGGLATDRSYYQLSLQETVAAQDLIAPNGIATQRRGWIYDGNTAEFGANVLVGIARNGFVLSGQTRTVTTNFTTTPAMIHNASGAGTSLFTATASGVVYLPRCVYRDELIICGQDGLRPLLRYSGGASGSVSLTSPTWTAGQSVVTAAGGTLSASPLGKYAYIASLNQPPTLYARILERNSATSATIEGVKASQTQAINSFTEQPIGFAWPAVSVYNAGTVTVSAGTVTGTGTKWLSAVNLSAEYGDEAILVIPASGGNTLQSLITARASDTSITSNAIGATNSSYAITRRLPFKDAAAHRGSLWGTGVAQFPDRVYVSPPGWNPSLPPGFTEPYDPTTTAFSPNANDFLLSYVDVPSPYDGDSNIAILPSSGPLLVLKRYSVYGVFGSYPSFQVSLIPGGQGAGCDDIRTAISVPEGQFWAGQLGVFTYRNGQVVELTRGRINREWRARFRSGINWIMCGVVANHLIVRANGADEAVYVYDLVQNVWVSKFSNSAFGYFWRSKVGTEQERLLSLSPSGTRVIDVGPMFDIANTSGNPKDADGTSPRMQAQTGPALAQAAGIDGEAKLLDVAVDANLNDLSAPSTAMNVSVGHQGSLENPTARSKFLGTITADTAGYPKRTKFRDVNRSGRLHWVTVEATPIAANNARIEVPEIALTWRDTRGQT